MASSKIRLLISNIDGSLLTSDGSLTQRTQEAIGALRAAGTDFAMVSHRLPNGLRSLIHDLGVTAPCAALQGGVLFNPDGTEIFEKHLREATVQEIVGILERFSLDPWIYTPMTWYVVHPETRHVGMESQRDVLLPETFKSVSEIRGPVIKVTGVTDDRDALARCKKALKDYFSERLSISSRTNFVDVTHRGANKGRAVTWMSGLLEILLEEVAVVGAMEDDIAMFRVSGMSIAMGQAQPEVRDVATYTAPPNDDGLAWAIENLILDDHLTNLSGDSCCARTGENDE